MTGIGGQEEQGKVVTVQTPLPPTVDGVMDTIREIILKGKVIGISVKWGEPIIYERYVAEGEEVDPSESTQSFAELSPMDVVRNVDMEEFDEAEYQMEHMDGPARLMWMYLLLENQGYTVTHVLLAEESDFWSWIGIMPTTAKDMDRFLGARVVRDKALPDNVFLLCGSPHRGATVAEIKFVLKGNIPGEENEGANEEGS